MANIFSKVDNSDSAVVSFPELNCSNWILGFGVDLKASVVLLMETEQPYFADGKDNFFLDLGYTKQFPQRVYVFRLNWAT